jgi:hypothetical protein
MSTQVEKYSLYLALISKKAPEAFALFLDKTYHTYRKLIKHSYVLIGPK